MALAVKGGVGERPLRGATTCLAGLLPPPPNRTHELVRPLPAEVAGVGRVVVRAILERVAVYEEPSGARGVARFSRVAVDAARLHVRVRPLKFTKRGAATVATAFNRSGLN